jgi:anti-anti-sigma factor
MVWFSPSRRVAVVRPSGELDVRRAGSLREALIEADQARALVVVDLADVTFADSVVAGLLVGAWKRSDRSGRTFVAANAGGQVLRTLTLLQAVHFLVDPRPAR